MIIISERIDINIETVWALTEWMMSEGEEDEGVQEGRRGDGDKAGDKVGLFSMEGGLK